MNEEQQKEILYLVGSICGPGILAILIATTSPMHNCCSFFPEILMIMIPGAYCFYALRSIINVKLRAAILAFAVVAAIAILTAVKTVPIKTVEETQKEGPKTEFKHKQGQSDFNSISSALKQGFK